MHLQPASQHVVIRATAVFSPLSSFFPPPSYRSTACIDADQHIHVWPIQFMIQWAMISSQAVYTAWPRVRCRGPFDNPCSMRKQVVALMRTHAMCTHMALGAEPHVMEHRDWRRASPPTGTTTAD